MAVIPLILDGPTRTVVDTRDAFTLEGKAVLIEGLDPSQLSSPGDSNVTYDLRVGGEYRDHRDRGKSELGDNEAITLPPGAAVIIETEEHVRLPRSMFGHIVPKVSLLQDGISNTSSKVDPGYDGRLLVTVFNLGKKTVTLGRKQPFCSLYILSVFEGARPYTKSAKRIHGEGGGRPWQKVRDRIDKNGAELVALLIVISIWRELWPLVGWFISRLP